MSPILWRNPDAIISFIWYYKLMFSGQFNFSLPIRDLSDFTGHYGASKLASSYCGLSKTRQVPGLWQHGPSLPNITSSQYIKINPGALTDGDLHNFAKSFWRYFVASREILFYLKSIDYKNVYAIGLPFNFSWSFISERPKEKFSFLRKFHLSSVKTIRQCRSLLA